MVLSMSESSVKCLKWTRGVGFNPPTMKLSQLVGGKEPINGLKVTKLIVSSNVCKSTGTINLRVITALTTELKESGKNKFECDFPLDVDQAKELYRAADYFSYEFGPQPIDDNPNQFSFKTCLRKAIQKLDKKFLK